MTALGAVAGTAVGSQSCGALVGHLVGGNVGGNVGGTSSVQTGARLTGAAWLRCAVVGAMWICKPSVGHTFVEIVQLADGRFELVQC